MPASSHILDQPSTHRDAASFRRQPDKAGVLYTVQPVRPPLAFQAAALLLAGLFGAPALGVALDPSRHDGISLMAAMVGVGVAGLACLAFSRARRNRRARPFRLAPEGVEQEGRLRRWQSDAILRVVQPRAGLHAQGATGIHGLAARIAAQQHAAEASLVLEGTEGGPLLLATGLDPLTASALQQAVLRDLPPRSQAQ